MKPGRLLGLSVVAVLGFYALGALEQRRRRNAELDAQLTGIPVDEFGRVLGVDGKPVADRLMIRDGEVFDRLAFQRAVDSRLGGL